jgi:drug/metabolite transporter (DMT)-like permease
LRLKADLTLFGVSLIWGCAFITQGIAAQHQLAYLFNGVCFLLAALILLPLIPREVTPAPGQLAWTGAAGLVLFAGSALQQVGIYYTNVANAGFITSLYVVITPFLLWLFFREKAHTLQLAAVALAIAGAYFLSTGGRGLTLRVGDALEALGALFWGIHFLVVGKFTTRYNALAVAAGQYLVAGLLNGAIGLFVESPSALASLPVIGAVLFRSTLSIALGYTLAVWGLKHTPPTDAAVILSLEAVFAALAGWFALGQGLGWVEIAGCALIFAAMLLAQVRGKLEARQTQEPICY